MLLLTFCVILSGSLWGLNMTVAKFATMDGAHPFAVTFWQCLIAALGLSVLAYITKERFRLTRKLFFVAALSGIVGLAIPNALFILAVVHLPVGVLSIIISVVPLLTLIFSISIRIDNYSGAKALGLTLGLISVLFVIVPQFSLSGSLNMLWLFVALLASVGYAVSNTLLGVYLPDSKAPLSIASGLFFAAALSILPAMLITNSFFLITLPLDRSEWAIILLGIFILIAHALYVQVIKYAGPVFASLATFVVAISGVFWGILILDEQHSNWIWSALILMLFSLVLVRPKNNKPAEPDDRSSAMVISER